ncbi:MAG: hypothetical protein R3A47_11575 [Polyangiales bacterium]
MDLGTTEPKELIDALKSYFTARFSHLQAITDHNIALSSLEKVTGTLLLEEKKWRPNCE